MIGKRFNFKIPLLWFFFLQKLHLLQWNVFSSSLQRAEVAPLATWAAENHTGKGCCLLQFSVLLVRGHDCPSFAQDNSGLPGYIRVPLQGPSFQYFPCSWKIHHNKMLLKLKSPKGWEQISLSRRKSMQGTAERERLGPSTYRCWRGNYLFKGLHLPNSERVYWCHIWPQKFISKLLYWSLFIFECIVSSEVSFFRSKVMLKDLIAEGSDFACAWIYILWAANLQQLLGQVADSETLSWKDLVIWKDLLFTEKKKKKQTPNEHLVGGSLTPLLVVPLGKR